MVGASPTARDIKGAAGSSSKPLPPISVTPLSAVRLFQPNVESTGKFDGMYTRLVVDGDVSSGPGDGTDNKVLGYNSRTWLGRLLFGKHSSLNLSAKVTSGSFTASVPLITLDHVSNSADGEVFTRIVNHRSQNFPLFLVKRDAGSGVVNIQFSLKASDTTASTAAGTALSVATSVAKLVSPESAVITTLSQQSNKNAAAAVDQAISRLFSTSVDEEHVADDDIGRWGNGTKGVGVKLTIPSTDGGWTDTVGTYPVGSWTIRFEEPRPSIFSDRRFCEIGKGNERCAGTIAQDAFLAAYNMSNAGEVLAFQLIAGAQSLGTVASYLKQLDWFTVALGKFGATPDTETVAGFCRNIKGSITGIGLNGLDADIVAKAVADGMVLPGKTASVMKNVADCGHSSF